MSATGSPLKDVRVRQGLNYCVDRAGLVSLLNNTAEPSVGWLKPNDPAFGKLAGNVSLALGIVGLGAATIMLVDPLSLVAALGVFALIAFHFVAGWKTYRLSRTA